MNDGKVKWLADGNIPDGEAKNLQVGNIIYLNRLKANTSVVGDHTSDNGEDSIPREKYKIIKKQDKKTEIDVPYVELELTQVA